MFFGSFLLRLRPRCQVGLWWLLVILRSKDGGWLSWWVLEGVWMLIRAILKFGHLGRSMRGVETILAIWVDEFFASSSFFFGLAVSIHLRLCTLLCSILSPKGLCTILIWWLVLFESLWSNWDIIAIPFWGFGILHWRLEVTIAEWWACPILWWHCLKASLFNKYSLLQTLDIFRELEISRIQFMILGSLSFKFVH